MSRLGGLLVVVLLLLPTAAAEVATGAFVVEGRVSLPKGADSSLDASLLFLGDAARLTGLHGTFEDLVVHAFEMQGVCTPSFQLLLPPTHSQFNLTDADVRLKEAARDGYLGVYPYPEGRTTFLPSEPFVTAERDRTAVSTAVGTDLQGHPLRSGEYYHQVVEGPHLYSETRGALAYEGPGFVKVFGPGFTVQGREGARTFATGAFSQGDPCGTLTLRWVVLEFRDGLVKADADAPWTLAMGSLSSEWAGVATLEAVAGEMSDSASRYLPIPAPAEIHGRFTSHLAPEGAGRIRVSLEGDLTSTSLRVQSLPLAVRLAGDAGPPALLLAVGVALASAGVGFTGGWYAAWRRRPAAVASADPAPFTVEDCCDAGAKAASEEDWAAAAKWFARAHALAPTSARVCGDLAFALSQIGDIEAALRLYAEASRLSEDGEADFNAALAALQADRPAEEVETWLERALERAPSLVVPLDGDSDFHVLKGRPRYEEAVRRAWERLGVQA